MIKEKNIKNSGHWKVNNQHKFERYELYIFKSSDDANFKNNP